MKPLPTLQRLSPHAQRCPGTGNNTGNNTGTHARARARTGTRTGQPWPALAGLALFASMAWGWPSGAWADKVNHDQALRAVQNGEVLPLSTLLEKIATHAPGQVMEVELEQKHTAWVYEVKVLQSDGRLLKLKLDARDGRVLQRQAR